MPIYKLAGGKIVPVERTTFHKQGLHERRDIQVLLKSRIEVLCPDTLVVAEEFWEWEDSRRRIDLLGIDKNASLVVVELKRTEDGDHMELQAIRYASMISTLTFVKGTDHISDVAQRLRSGYPMCAHAPIYGWQPDVH